MDFFWGISRLIYSEFLFGVQVQCQMANINQVHVVAFNISHYSSNPKFALSLKYYTVDIFLVFKYSVIY